VEGEGEWRVGGGWREGGRGRNGLVTIGWRTEIS
jgi:hypothetical protein